MTRVLIAVGLVSLQVVGAGKALAFEREHGSVELGVLAGATFFLTDEDNLQFTGSLPNGSSGIHAPITPALRFTFWTETPVLIDWGASVFSSNIFGENFTAMNFEVGVGVRSPYPSRVVPWASVLMGFVSWSAETKTNGPYLGGQLGVRTFVTGRTSFRVQAGYRHILDGPPSGFEVDAVEVGLGLGVYL